MNGTESARVGALRRGSRARPAVHEHPEARPGWLAGWLGPHATHAATQRRHLSRRSGHAGTATTCSTPRLHAAMKSVPLLLALAAVALGAPSPTRTPRQAPAPGADILTTISEAFQQHVMQKQERVLDVVDTLGKALGSVGDTVRQTISDGLGTGADGGQRSAGPAAASDKPVGQKVGEVLADLGGKLLQAATANKDDDGQRSVGPAAATASPVGQKVGEVLADLGGRLLQAATANKDDDDGQRSASASAGEDGARDRLEDVGRKVGHMLVSALRKSIQRGEDDEDDDDEARLVGRARPPPPPEALQPLIASEEVDDGQDKVPCRMTSMSANSTSSDTSTSTSSRRGRRGRGKRAAPAAALALRGRGRKAAAAGPTPTGVAQ